MQTAATPNSPLPEPPPALRRHAVGAEMTQDRDEGTRKRNEREFGASFARLLGERWQTSGDGIYVLVEDAQEQAEDLERRQTRATAKARPSDTG